DVSMPDMNGMEATRRIRRLGSHGADVPIVAMTAHAVKGYREECLAVGMNDYATKPIAKQDLLALVAKWTGCARRPRAGRPRTRLRRPSVGGRVGDLVGGGGCRHRRCRRFGAHFPRRTGAAARRYRPSPGRQGHGGAAP
ncbi:response regulator, partial [Methylogaea oryzae]|uniref:response regulator n=1 Tax=Methylogaea oryzae TaxID=1295382 RepID=UPI0012E0E8AD